MMHAPVRHQRQRQLCESERRDDVDVVDAAQRLQRIGGQLGLGAGAEGGRVVDEQVDALAGGVDERAAVPVVGHVAGQGPYVGDGLEFSGDPLELGGPAGVDDEPVAALRQRPGERQSEAAGGSGDDCC